MFNNELKSKYLETKSELTRKQYQSFYNKTEEYERNLGKDLHGFTFEEILYTINELQPKNEKQENVYRSFVSGYINWTIEQGIRSNNVNPFLINKEREIWMEIYEVFLLNGKRTGCTSRPLEIGEEVQFASLDGISKKYIVNDVSHTEKFYFVTEK